MHSNDRFDINGSNSSLRGEREARALLAAGDFIAAIKKLRVTDGLSLKDAKDIVDRWRDDAGLRQSSRTTAEISAVRRIYTALLSQPEENRARILKAAAVLAETSFPQSP